MSAETRHALSTLMLASPHTLEALDEVALMSLDYATFGDDDLDLDVADDPTVVETLSCDVDVTARFIRVVSFL